MSAGLHGCCPQCMAGYIYMAVRVPPCMGFQDTYSCDTSSYNAPSNNVPVGGGTSQVCGVIPQTACHAMAAAFLRINSTFRTPYTALSLGNPYLILHSGAAPVCADNCTASSRGP
ncbi:hypothetical protein GDO78_006190 [Eleutherodactylus coqui]|uniref:Uncharacterized protein n=1 Tax=Eleutherodactylus coqui TaxID=57060 RepID=A0A8J6KFX7_ELECQ|nr:hypothetical protein GDO78_006190 [Eleutherodactylus coqui]